MDEELKAQIIPIIENTKEGLAKAVDFLCEQSPILVKEILWWHGIRSAILFIVLLAAFVYLCAKTKKVFGWLSDQRDPDIPLAELGMGTYCVGTFMACPTLLIANLTWLKILVAPRLFLLEFMKDAIT